MLTVICPRCACPDEPGSDRCWVCGQSLAPVTPAERPIRGIDRVIGTFAKIVGGLIGVAVLGFCLLLVTCFASLDHMGR
jgi:hypothetical protein